MSILIIVVHVIVCLALILIVLLQTGKGADIGAAFGGSGSQTLFGASGAMTFLNKATTIVAVVFMLTCLILAYMSTNTTSTSIMEDAPAPIEQPVATTDAAAPAAPAAETAAPAPAPAAPAAEQAPAAEPAPAKTE